METSKYDFKIIENERQNLEFSSERGCYSGSVLMPPPNITGNLHLGHSLDLLLQDFIIRASLLVGKNLTWISGVDHAGIATQSKIESFNLPFENDNQKRDFAFKQWYPQQREKFIQQWKKMGLLLDYQQDNFTMNPQIQAQVREFFGKLYHDGHVYQSLKIVNWDPQLKTVISDIEIDHHEVERTLYYVRYQLVNSSDSITVVTSRPETIFADVALFINPQDSRYHKLQGLFAVNPLTGSHLPILSSEEVLPDFGSGVLKCTPGHDFKDYDLAKKFALPIVVCYDQNGVYNQIAGQWQGLNYRDVKNDILDWMRKNDLIIKEEVYTTKNPYSQRSGALVEPFVSLQWFLDLPALVSSIENDHPNFLQEINFFPTSIAQKLENWKETAHEWCISRQLWWGHKIPIWYDKQGNGHFFSDGRAVPSDYKQDNDVLDTWFSSSLWPLMMTSGDTDLFPIEYLVTGSDLLFFWLFKMIVFGFYFRKQPPFKNVLIHGLIRDKNGKKMSKSLGNGVEPDEIISQYGADSLRLFLLSNSVLGNDLVFDNGKLKGSYFFLQKIWSIFNYIKLHLNSDELKFVSWEYLKSLLDSEDNYEVKILSFWILNELSKVESAFKETVIGRWDTSFLAKLLIEFTREKVSNSYIYLLKDSLSKTNMIVLLYVFQHLICLFNPFIPFITDYIYEHLTGDNKIDSIEFLDYQFDCHLESFSSIEMILLIRSRILAFYQEKKLPVKNNKIEFNLKLVKKDQPCLDLISSFIEKLNKIENFEISLDKKKFIKPDFIDVSPFGILEFSQQKRQDDVKFKENLEFYQSEIERCLKLLNNPSFIEKAPMQLVEQERKKLANYQVQMDQIIKGKDN